MKWYVQRHMTCADFHPRGLTGDQGDTNADIFFITHQPIGVIQSEGQANDRCHRCQGYIPLIKIKANTQYLLALVLAFTNDSGIGNGGRVRTGSWTGQTETGYFFTLGKTRQVVVLLLICAVVDQ